MNIVNKSTFLRSFNRGLLTKMLTPMLPEIQMILNRDGQRGTHGPIQIDLENNSYHAVHSYIKSNTTGPELSDAYQEAFPKTGRPMAAVRECLKQTSLLLQQESWPYCQEGPPCRRPNCSNRADITLNYVESLSNLPQQFMGQKLFSLPLMVMEVEGSQAKWGIVDQQAKAMREVLVSLAVMPECYLIFIYPKGIEIWKAERNPARCCIDVTAERIEVNDQDRTIRQVLEYFLKRIFEIIAHQACRILPLIEYNLQCLRRNRQVLATGHIRNLWMGDCCEDCYVLPTIRSAAGLLNVNGPYELDWEGLPPTRRPDNGARPSASGVAVAVVTTRAVTVAKRSGRGGRAGKGAKKQDKSEDKDDEDMQT